MSVYSSWRCQGDVQTAGGGEGRVRWLETYATRLPHVTKALTTCAIDIVFLPPPQNCKGINQNQSSTIGPSIITQNILPLISPTIGSSTRNMNHISSPPNTVPLSHITPPPSSHSSKISDQQKTTKRIMPIRTEIEDNKRRRPMNKLPIVPLSMTSSEGKPVLLPKTANGSPQLGVVSNASPLLSNATARLNLNVQHSSSPNGSPNDKAINNSQTPPTKGTTSHTQIRKAVHLASEKKRRQNISDGFSDLRVAISNACLPTTTSAIIMPTDSKATVLRKAAVAINEQTDEIKRMRTLLYGDKASSSYPRVITLVSSDGGKGGSTTQDDYKDVMESAATLTSLKHMTRN